MIIFIVALSISLTVFCITSIVVIVRRRQQAARNVGYAINEGGPPVMVTTSHAQPGGMPVYHYAPPEHHPVVITSASHTPGSYPVAQYPPPGYPMYSGYAPYPGQNSSQITVQMTGMQAPMSGGQTFYPPMQQRTMNPSDAEITVLPAGDNPPVTKQSHQGAVETVSQI